MLEKLLNTLGDPIIYQHTKFDGDMPPKLNSKHAFGVQILLTVSILTGVLLRDLLMCDHTKFQPNDTQKLL